MLDARIPARSPLPAADGKAAKSEVPSEDQVSLVLAHSVPLGFVSVWLGSRSHVLSLDISQDAAMDLEPVAGKAEVGPVALIAAFVRVRLIAFLRDAKQLAEPGELAVCD